MSHRRFSGRPTRRLLLAGVMPLAFLAACGGHEQGHDHASEHAPGHDHHAAGDGHGDLPVVRITLHTERLELFAEHTAAVAGAEVELLAHLTLLDGFRALDRAQLRLELVAAVAAPATTAPLVAETTTALRPGIFRLTFIAPQAGNYRARILVGLGGITDSIEGLLLEVHATAAKARASVKEHDDGRFIELLKEQQWAVPFATAAARRGTLVAAIEVAGTITTPPGGAVEVSAPITGRLVAPARGLARPGDAIRKGQQLATLAPAPSAPEDAARAAFAVSEAEARLATARATVERSERLLVDHAISTREVDDARREVGVAEAALRAARETRQLFRGASGGDSSGAWQLVSPIAGTLVAVLAMPGATVAPGAPLFRVVDLRELWLRARVPEQDATRLRTDRYASFQLTGVTGVTGLAGVDEWLPLNVTDKDSGVSLVTVGPLVDPSSRTVDVLYSLTRPDPRLRVGGLVRVSLPAGADFTGVVIPRSAIISDDGREVVYVQVDGEHFEERQVRTGPRQGALIGVTDGLTGDERVVVRGAHVVRLTAGASSAVPHGHLH